MLVRLLGAIGSGSVVPKIVAQMTAARAKSLRTPGFHAVGVVPGLHLAINAKGSRSWILRYSFAGRRRDMGLGPFDLIGLAEARELATAARRQILAGVDPLEARRAQRASAILERAKAITFKECAETYLAAHERGWDASTGRQWRASIRDNAYPVFGDLPVAAIDTALVMQAIEPIWNQKPETANRVRGRIESILDWAAVRTYRAAGDNPARWRGHIEHLLPARSEVRKIEHFTALPYAEIGSYMAQLREQTSIPARALQFLILTAARSSEVTGASWPEFNLAEKLWTIPAERMKAGNEHRVPLSDAALAILKAMAEIRQGDLVFPGAHGGKMRGLALRRAATGRRDGGGLSVHGFRSSFRDWAAERTNFPNEVCEMALAHTVSTEVERAYRRGDMFDRRRRLMDEWSRFCAAPSVDAGDKVVTLAR
jgi:integrase